MKSVAARFNEKVIKAYNASASNKHKRARMHLDNAKTFLFGVPVAEYDKINHALKTYKTLREKYNELLS